MTGFVPLIISASKTAFFATSVLDLRMSAPELKLFECYYGPVSVLLRVGGCFGGPFQS